MKAKIVKVRCGMCGRISWWLLRRRYVCKACGAKEGMVINLLREELKRRRSPLRANSNSSQGYGGLEK